MKTSSGLILGLALLSTTAIAGTTGQHAKAPGAPATNFQVTNLVSNQDGVAANTDADLVNSWGLAQAPHGPLWVNDQGSGKATVYDSHTGEKQALTVTVPGGGPTGIAFVPDDGNVDFPITANSVTAQSIFVFATESGMIEGWNPNVDPTNAVVAVDNSASGAVYTGLGISDGKDRLYAADFRHNRVDIYDSNFNKIGVIRDRQLPNRFGPFNVKVMAGLVYVAFAKHEKGAGDEITGDGLGYVDVFDRSGRLKSRLVANGPLNAPWGMVLAPKSFGTFASDLLVGNFGDGKINAFDSASGDFLGTLSTSDGNPIVLDGLWALDNRPVGGLTFSSGPDDEANGLVGSITPVLETAQK